MKNKYDYVLGIDVGISSVGYGLLQINEKGNIEKIIAANSRIFTPGEVAKTGASKAESRRMYRGSRRIIRRREHRVARVKSLLEKNGYIEHVSDSENFSLRTDKLNKKFNELTDRYYTNSNKTPYDIKYEGLFRKLTNDELSIILVHYAKHRGYKSNREIDDAIDEAGKVKSSINENLNLMKSKKYVSVSHMFSKDSKFSDRVRNSEDDYKMSVTREMYEEEINLILDTQIKYKLINDKFKDEYLEIWCSQRHYSKGPGGASPYGGDLIRKMVGVCKFTGEPRAAKSNFSSELFVLLSKLTNLHYKKVNDKEYKNLSVHVINQCVKKAQNSKELKYKDLIYFIQKEENSKDSITFKGLDLSKKNYIKFIKNFKINTLNLKKDNTDKIIYKNLTDNQKNEYTLQLNKMKSEQILGSLTTYHKFKKYFIEKDKDLWLEIRDDIDVLDEIATLLTYTKLDEEIISAVLESDKLDDRMTELIVGLPNCNDHLMISRSLILKLNDKMFSGKKYHEALNEILGKGETAFTDVSLEIEKFDLLPPFNIGEKIVNQRVDRSLAECRKVINAVIKKYGMPKMINVEVARDLALDRSERNKLTKMQLDRYEDNVKIKNYLVDTFPQIFPSIERISGSDLLKYKLWIEQNECCAYSQTKISIMDLFDRNIVQIDHILPYSRTYNDNYLNKTLVFSKSNQDKRNMTPYEWMGHSENWKKFENYINNLNISQAKKDNYLLVDLTIDMQRAMRNQNLNDTKYIARALVGHIHKYLNVDKVNSYSGVLTSKLRGLWGLNNLTHSLESSEYRLTKDKGDIKKNRDNHLHHAMDALVIASVTPKLEQSITKYEKYNRYLNRVTKKIIEDFIKNGDIGNEEIVIHDTGEVIKKDNLKEYVNELIVNEQLAFEKNGKSVFKYPKPYLSFSEDLIKFVFERDEGELYNYFKNTDKYSEEELNLIKPLMPSIAKNKISGKLHKETYYSIKNINFNSDEKQFYLERISLNSPTFKEEILEKMYQKDSGSKEVYLTIKSWLNGFSTGEEAFKKFGFPKNAKNNLLIKKIKVEKEYLGKGHIVNGSLVESGDMHLIGIYTSKKDNDNTLYFAGYDVLDCFNIKNNGTFNVNIWEKQNYCKSYEYQNLLNEFNEVCLLNKNQLVKITLKDKRNGICYINGFSSGKLEIKSVLGDGFDLYSCNGLQKKECSRYYLTISTIEKIEILKITVLGEIDGLSSSNNN